MTELTVNGAILTPLFMGGPKGKGHPPEFRAAGLKGCLRYWWRALHPHLPRQAMAKLEEQIFGGVRLQARRSELVIQVLEEPQSGGKKYPLLPHRQGTGQNPSPEYAFDPGDDFTLLLRLRSEKHLSQAQLIALLRVAFTLGGLGKRSRRGMGAVAMQAINGVPEPELTTKGLFDQLEQLVPGAFAFTSEDDPIVRSSSYRSADYPYLLSTQIGFDGKEEPTAWPFLIGLETHEQKDKLRKKGEPTWKYDQQMGGARPRMASPVYTSVVYLEDCYFPIVSRLHTALPPHKGSVPTLQHTHIQDQFSQNIIGTP